MTVVKKSRIEREYTLKPEQALRNLRTLVDVISDGNVARRKLIFVVDQDNRLNKVLFQIDFELSKKRAAIINEVIATNRAHMTVASASANNEGWVRRGWVNTVVQKAHGLDPADADHMIQAALKPVDRYSEAVSLKIQEVTGRCPLDIKLICDNMVAAGPRASDEAASVVDGAVRNWEGALKAQFDAHWRKVGSDKSLFAEAYHQKQYTALYDFRFMEWSAASLDVVLDWGEVTFRNPTIMMYIVALVFQAPMVVCSDATVYERNVCRVLPVRLNSVQKNVRPMLHLLSGTLPTEEFLKQLPRSGMTYVLTPCERAPFVDAISIQRWGGICFVGLYQITLNRNHNDSYMQVHQKSNNAPLYISNLRKAVESACEVKVDMRFFWITPNEQLESGGFTVKGRQLTGVLHTTEAVKSEPHNAPFTKNQCWNFLFDTSLSVLAVTKQKGSLPKEEDMLLEYVIYYRPDIADVPVLMSTATNTPIV